jgi:tetratricopeptide (TPR) repeat protein
VYDLTERGKELEEAHSELYRRDMKVQERIEAILEMLKEWPGHANAATALARYYGQRDHFDHAIELLEKTIFVLQKYWPEDIEGVRITAEWAGNKPMLTAYAYMVLDCAEAGDHASAKAFAEDFLKVNPIDNLGVRQKAIELAISDGEYAEALRLINEAADPASAYNIFGRALLGYILKANDVELALKTAVEARPLIWREMAADKHRMPHNYNPSFVLYNSPEEAYNYQQTWAPVWLRKHGALAWLKKEGRKYAK